MKLQPIAGGFIANQLSGISPVPSTLQELLERACIRLFDASMIIEDSMQELAPLRDASIKQPLEQFEQTFVIDQIIDSVRDEGLADNFHNMIGLFGSIMLSLTATEEQLQQVNDWVNRGIFGHFLMTDPGGPSLQSWKTDLDDTEGNLVLNVDKNHGIEAHKLGFAMVVTKQAGRPFPLTVMLPPELCSQLHQRAIGEPFLDGKLQLGNCNGSVPIRKDMLLSKGGLGSVNRFLTLVRPRFVKSLMHFVLWLNGQGEAELTSIDQEHVEYLIFLCNQQVAETVFSMHSVNRVLATKFSSNELLLDLVSTGKIKSLARQRDLLAFTKMEGSSYRCFFEIYSKFKGLRV
ncbi:hypothetical protein MO867_10390 [Microbulbifer sp. OS29]|uniref:Uncharacterized protein n=1 Tax=Microbulbifer okhotskensis TaxID=2926617 RepID=A0A9X2EM31_9GAMM|nr:hypothetical protein [Microbulbifer okhotskensis]MCO1334747.1 hypothetical protein [Microbulbifer okhotskensis]